MECIALKAVNIEGDRLGVFTQAGQVTLYLGHTGSRGGGEAGICGRGAWVKFCQWESVPKGLSGTSGRVDGLGQTPSGGMGPQVKSFR